ncbi:hypothetical protein QBC40DRAFT_289321 [Triangularia verruculosa]|uniref:C2H2-type domain-containing protein n=1 Tax=Triangularia verruculosa TaxID=2587418 RepID=A0AAN6X721_9PEZI|nr:hypothetical protein QBC40DRAFT_289321 [Triangularia verruculosa]
MDSNGPRQETPQPSSAPQDGASAIAVPRRSGAIRHAAGSRPILHTLTPGVGKHTFVTTPIQETPADDDPSRHSWVSFVSASTARSSAVPSIFSQRLSTFSASTRLSIRQSSIESPISATSPLYLRTDSIKEEGPYFCTFCSDSFATKEEWRLHEADFHDKREIYSCKSCSAVFRRAISLMDHESDEHGIESTGEVPLAARHSPLRAAWGCGFCATLFRSRTDYLDHVGDHYDEGLEREHWQHSLVIKALLQQPKIEEAWKALVAEEEAAEGATLRFMWDPSNSGRLSDVEESSSLQDVLEFFGNKATLSAEEIAVMAYDLAQKRVQRDVSNVLPQHFARLDPDEIPETEVMSTAGSSSASPQDLPQSVDDMSLAATSKLHITLSSNLAKSSFSSLIADKIARESSTSRAPGTIGDGIARPSSVPAVSSQARPPPSIALRNVATRGNLRRVDNGLPRSPPAFQISENRSGTPPRPSPGGLGSTITSLSSTQDSSTPVHLPDHVLVARASPLSSIRPHTSSSTLSSHAKDTAKWLDDSTSGTVTDDSVSDTDSWLEPDGLSSAARTWKSTFNQTVELGMGALWTRYNRDWNALIVQCVGEAGRSSSSPHYRDTSGRVRKGTSSRQAKNLRPGGRYPVDDEDEDDDDGEGQRPGSSLSKRSSLSTKKFACPFRKHDPQKYSLQEHEVCAVRSWGTISRLKEHLYRRHYKIHCQRCKQTFGDFRELADHEMSPQGCVVVHAPPPCDISTIQEKQLKSRKHNAKRKTDEEKWVEIYQLLFPNEDIPSSPYPEVVDDMGQISSETQSSMHFQHFLLRTLPALFSQMAEEQIGRPIAPHEALRMDTIPTLIEGSLQKAFSEWEARGNNIMPAERSAVSMSFIPELVPEMASLNIPYSYAPASTYHTPPMSAAPSADHSFLSGNLGGMGGFTPENAHDDDSGFVDNSFQFQPGPPATYAGFIPQYDTSSDWQTGLGLMHVDDTDMGFGNTMNMGAHYPGFSQG